MNTLPLQTWLGVLLALAVAAACARLLLWQWRAPAPARTRGWRLALLLALQPLCALLLFRTLVPPLLETEHGTLTVLTAGATRAQLAASAPGEVLVALPEAPPLRDAARVPDLETALRRHPGTARIRVVGAGLEARDRDAVGARPLAFEPPPLPAGFTALWTPARVAAGDGFRIAGAVHGVDGGSVELIDPAGRRVDAAALSEDGAFLLEGTARAPGTAEFALRVRAAKGAVVEELALPLWIADDPAPRVLLLAGAPNPEVRALRRWAADAGMSLHEQVAVGGGVELGDAPLAMDADTLREFDLAVLDERAWAALGEGRRAALLAAAREGLGVLLRVTGPLPESARAQLRAFGFQVSAGTATAALALPQPDAGDEDAWRARLGAGTADAPLDPDLAAAPPPALLRRDLRIDGDDVVPVRGVAAEPWLHWRAEGRGRIALSTLTDSYRLVQSGRGDLHAELWSAAFAAAARTAAAAPRFEPLARAGERTVICGVGTDGRILAPDGGAVAPLPDPAAGPVRCAAYWPRTAGWHRLQQGGRTWPFFVRARDEAAGLRAAELREATLRRVGDAAPVASGADTHRPPRRGPSWPWFLAWLVSVAGLWWLERRRPGFDTGPRRSAPQGRDRATR